MGLRQIWKGSLGNARGGIFQFEEIMPYCDLHPDCLISHWWTREEKQIKSKETKKQTQTAVCVVPQRRQKDSVDLRKAQLVQGNHDTTRGI